MFLNLMYITNNPKVAKIAERSGVNWIFIDLEINGKEDRQGHLDTVISKHKIEDVKNVKKVLNKSKLLVRVNPIFENSKSEIDSVINSGADIVMLPFFKIKDEVEKFINYVGQRAKVMLLLETPEAVSNIDDILDVKGIDYVHIGLNDLHLGYKMKFMFELLAEGIVDRLCKKIKSRGIPYGFGGIAKVGEGVLPAENIIAEHYRLGSSAVILSRSFCDIKKLEHLEGIESTFEKGIKDIRNYEKNLDLKEKEFFIENHNSVSEKVHKIVESIIKKSC